MESVENIQKYVGEELNISGFVLQNENTNENEFFLSRFVLRCCTADARPVAIKVISSELISWKNGDWLEVNGVFQSSSHDTEILEIKMNTAKIVPIPDNPYIN